MRAILCKTAALLCAFLVAGPRLQSIGTECSSEALEKQQRFIDTRVQVALVNLLTFWNMKFPGRDFQFDHSDQRTKAWNPPLSEAQKKAVKLNTGLGCITFIATKDAPEKLPDLCAPTDVRAQMTMEAMREAYMNTRGIDEPMIKILHETFPELFGEARVLFCVMRPDASYIGLDDQLASCAK